MATAVSTKVTLDCLHGTIEAALGFPLSEDQLRSLEKLARTGKWPKSMPLGDLSRIAIRLGQPEIEKTVREAISQVRGSGQVDCADLAGELLQQLSAYDPKTVRLKILEQGAPIVNSARLVTQGDMFAAITVDLASKYCVNNGAMGGEGCAPAIQLGTTKRSLNLKKGKPKSACTTVEFPDFVNWEVFAYEVSQHTVRVTLLPRRAGDD